MLHKTETNVLKLKNDSKSRESWRVNGILKKYYIRCGKDNCRCMTKNKLHGTYWYLIWDDKIKTRKRYVKKKDLDIVRASIRRGRYWKEKLTSDIQQTRVGVDTGVKTYNATKKGVVFEGSEMLDSVISFKQGLDAMKLTKLRNWYVVENDYNTRFKVLNVMHDVYFSL